MRVKAHLFLFSFECEKVCIYLFGYNYFIYICVEDRTENRLCKTKWVNDGGFDV